MAFSWTLRPLDAYVLGKRTSTSQYSPSLRNNFDSLARDQRQPGSFHVSEMSLGTRLRDE